MPHVHKLPSGNWRAIVKHGGVTRSVTGTTKGDAQRRAAEVLIELGDTPRYAPSVRELLEAHLAVVKLSPTTLADYRSVVDRIPDTFLDRRTLQVTPTVVESLHRQLAEGGMSNHRIGRVHDLLSAAWQRAIRLEWAVRNPMRSVPRPPVESLEIHPPTPEQVAALIAAAPADFADFVRLAASTGARRSELVALRWEDVNVDVGQIAIRRSLVYTKASGVVERETKTGRKGHRVIAVALPVTAALRRRRGAQVELAVAGGVTPQWVFSATAGATPWGPTYPTLAFGRARQRAGLPGIRLHDLRHFVATQMLAAGHSVAQVSARLGQTQAATTARYSHWIPARDREAAEALEALIG